MQAVSKLAVLLSLVALAPVAALATTNEQAFLESCRKAPEIPVPVSVVTPTVGSEYIGATVQLEFIVDATGKPVDFSVKSVTDGTLATAVVNAVKQWRFTPAEKNGQLVAMKVALPVRIVEDSAAGSTLAMK